MWCCGGIIVVYSGMVKQGKDVRDNIYSDGDGVVKNNKNWHLSIWLWWWWCGVVLCGDSVCLLGLFSLFFY